MTFCDEHEKWGKQAGCPVCRIKELTAERDRLQTDLDAALAKLGGIEDHLRRQTDIGEAVKRVEQKHIETAMYYLENMPCGGVGEDGPTLGDLEKNMLKYSHHNAEWYTAQLAWRYLEKALKGKK